MFDVKYMFFAALIAKVVSDNCYVPWMESGHEVAESKFEIDLAVVNTLGPLNTYFPSTDYEVKIKSTDNQTFTQFYFMMSNVNKSKTSGVMHIREKDISKFHNGRFCVNKIIDGPSSLLKKSISIGWQSPPEGSGCIEMLAFVKETELRYHRANLTVCQDPRVELDDRGEILKNCCACAVAKYELSFEGLWTKYFHPRHYPAVELTAFFPTVLGASHDPVYEFWRPYTLASDGLKEFAWSGQTKALEIEMKKNRRSIGSLLKFQGSNFQNLSRKSYAYLTVTNFKHVVSLVSRLSPSPDWFVGVSSLELCRPDCKWMEEKILNLYTYDAGVRDGLLYEDIEKETEPQLEVQSLNMTWPEPKDDIVPPFFDKLNNTHDVRPLARLHFKLIRDSCAKTEDLDYCFTEYSEWGPCIGECGMGFRNRTRQVQEDYLNDRNCSENKIAKSTSNATDVIDPRLFQREPCKLFVECPKILSHEDCELESWGPWSKCNKHCGQEVTKRERKYKWQSFEETCEDKFGAQRLEEKMDCGNPPCPDEDYFCAECRYSDWKDWTPCSVTVGIGIRFRYRELQENYKKIDVVCDPQKKDYGYSLCLYEKEECNGTVAKVVSAPTDEDDNPVQVPATMLSTTKSPELDYCTLPLDEGGCDDGSDSNSLRYYYDQTIDKCTVFTYTGCAGNQNNFKTNVECEEICRPPGPKVNCKLREVCTECITCDQTSTCDYVIEVYAKNGGRPCAPSYRSLKDCSKVLYWCK